MADETKPRFKPKLEWLWTPLLVLVVYVLSVGPAYKLESKGLFPNSALETLYAPLEVLGRTEAGGAVLGWYVFDLWQVPFPVIYP